MKKILLIISLFFISFNLSYSRRSRKVEDIPWRNSYSINKFGEKDKIIGVECGKWAMTESIYIDNTGMSIKIYKRDYNLIDTVNNISFLFDSKDELSISQDIVDISSDKSAGTREFFIPKEHASYSLLIKKMKKSSNMSVLLEDKSGNIENITDINNNNLEFMLNKINKI